MTLSVQSTSLPGSWNSESLLLTELGMPWSAASMEPKKVRLYLGTLKAALTVYHSEFSITSQNATCLLIRCKTEKYACQLMCIQSVISWPEQLMADQGSVRNSTEMAESSPAMHLSKAMAYAFNRGMAVHDYHRRWPCWHVP